MSSNTVSKSDFRAERPKHEHAVLPYVIDFSDWLETGETLTDWEVESVESAGTNHDAGTLINGNTAIKLIVSDGNSGEVALFSIKAVVDLNKSDYRTLAIEIK